MISNLEFQAEAISQRMALPSFSLIALLPIIQAVLTCIGQDESNPAMVLQTFREMYTGNPKRTRKRIARQAYKTSWEEGTPMNLQESYVFADALIAQALEVDEQTAQACAMEAGVGSPI